MMTAYIEHLYGKSEQESTIIIWKELLNMQFLPVTLLEYAGCTVTKIADCDSIKCLVYCIVLKQVVLWDYKIVVQTRGWTENLIN